MKLTPAILFSSVTLNVLLLGALVMTWGDRRATKQVTAEPKSAPVKQAVTAQTPAAPPQPAKAAPFRWQQLDAPDFPTFVKNLRAIGCPEPTLRDIIEGELREIYAQKLQKVAAGSSGKPQEMETFELNNERDRLLASLTAPAGSPAPTAAMTSAGANDSPAYAAAADSTVPTAATDPNAAPSQPAARIPAAFAYAGNSGTALTVGQVAPNTKAASPQLGPTETTVLQQMQNDFAEALGDATKSPESPVYRQRWNAELDRSNERFRAQFGVSAYLRAEMQAARAGNSAP
jgi:hypothetical protein